MLAPTCWFDAGLRGEPYSVSIRFSGRRVGTRTKGQARDRFSQVETVEHVVPGAGEVSVTTRVRDINPGTWIVTKEQVFGPGRDTRAVKTLPGAQHAGTWGLRRKRLAWGSIDIIPGTATRAKTAFAPFVSAPGTFPLAWAGLVGAGIILALVIQELLVARTHLAVAQTLAVSLVGVFGGLVGSKLWYLALQRRIRALLEGMCIQGFLVGGLGTVLVGLGLLGIPHGVFLDAAAPGLFFGMTVGRFGCFFAGCCSGRSTASRCGVWSSDRRVGTRRIPTQLMESALSLAIGSTALILVLTLRYTDPGSVFVGAVAVYTLGRQLLLPLRAVPRKSSSGRWITMVATVAMVIATFVV